MPSLFLPNNTTSQKRRIAAAEEKADIERGTVLRADPPLKLIYIALSLELIKYLINHYDR